MTELLPTFPGAPQVRRDELDALPWRSVTPDLLAGGHAFRIRVTDAPVGRYLGQALAALPLCEDGDRDVETYSICGGVAGHPRWWVGYAGGSKVSTSHQPSAVITHVMAAVNKGVVREAPDGAVALHAAACATVDGAVLVAGPSGTGKSTLAAALVASGMQYLTDEVAVVDPDDLRVAPYPKPLSIDPGAWSVLPGLRPDVPPGAEEVLTTQWHVDPTALAGGVAPAPVAVRLVVRPRWEAGASVRVQDVPRSRTLVDLATDMFRPRHRLPHQLSVLARLLRQARTVELVHGHLDDAVDAVRQALRT